MDAKNLGRISPIRPSNSFIEFKKEEIENSIPHRFEQQVTRYPRKLALKIKNVQMTYEDLNKISNRIANSILVERDSRQEPVALLLGQWAQMISAILGILKSGKIYVPIDPSNPKSRIRYSLEDAQINLIITDNKHLSLSNELAHDNRRVLNIDALEQSPYSMDNPNLSISPNSFAYIFYTSGSTGWPKGVVDNHRNVLHNIMRYTNSLKIAPEDRLTLLQSCSFSGSVSSLLCSLLNGATVFPYNVRDEGMGINLANWLIEEGITIYHSVPMIFRSVLVEDLRFPKIRVVRLEGDAASRHDVELFKKYFEPGCFLVNGLGATETGITRQYFIDKDLQLSDNIVPIGYPVQDMEVQILDDEGQEVEINSVGEIAIKSNYLSPGYWRNPELTKASFLPDPSGRSERIYKTGDIGRMRAYDCLEYLGRKDFQLKIRGHRVEAAEVEGALLSLGCIKEVVVVTREDQHGDPQLVAYIVPDQKAAPDLSVLRLGLAKALPDYMIPTIFVTLENLPLNSNGKVDRRGLPDPELMRLGPSIPYLGPRDALEKQLVQIWKDLFGIKQIGIKDNFFELGGNSLLTAKIFARIKKSMGKDLPLATILQAPTVEELACILRKGEWTAPWRSLVAIQPGGTKPPFFYVHAHRGNVVGYYDLARHLGPDQPFYGLQAQGLDGKSVGIRRIGDMSAHYIEEIRTVQPEGPYFLGGYCMGGLLAFEMAQQLKAQGEEVIFLAMIQSNNPKYPKFLPRVTLIHRLIFRIIERVEFEMDKLRELGMKAKLSYLLNKIGRLMTIMQLKVEKRLDSLFAKFHWKISHSRGYALKILDEAHTKACENYEPCAYKGPIVIYYASKQPRGIYPDPSLGWGGLIEGELELHEIQSHYLDSFVEPSKVRVLAEKLKPCIEKAQNVGKLLESK